MSGIEKKRMSCAIKPLFKTQKGFAKVSLRRIFDFDDFESKLFQNFGDFEGIIYRIC